MAEIISLKAKGLYTHPSDISAVPEGALSVADNVVINKEDIIEPRRGLDKHSSLPNGSDRVSKLFSYQDKLIAAYTDGTLAYYDSGSWNEYSGSFDAPTGERVRATKANSNFYLTTDSGVKKLDEINATPTFVGAPRALDAVASLSGTSGFMSDDTQVAYRVLWGYKDENDNLILGAPSQRITLANSTGGTRDVSLTITIPDSVDDTWFFQVYRSPLSTSASTAPSDELQLVYETNPSTSEISALSLTFLDSTPESLLGADLYTNESQEGSLNANTQPPLAHDITTYKNVTFYANTTSKNRVFIDLLSTGGSTGVQLDDEITIGTVTYTAKSSEDVASDEFELFTSGTPAQNIEDTAKSLIRVINQSSSTVEVYAYYLSSADDLPGKILLEEREIGGSSFSISASANGNTAWNPGISTALASSNDRYLNGLFYSKVKQPESVPLLNFQQVGSASDKILRIAALRDSLFIFKEDGIYRLIGEDPSSFVVEEFDRSTKLLASETVQILNNQIFCLSDQGVVSVSDSGVAVLSRPIENSLLELFGANSTYYKSESFAVSYESDRKYVLGTISNAGDTTATQIFVWNTFTSSWTRWDIRAGAGIVNPSDDKLYLGKSDSSNISIERKSYGYTDFADQTFDVTITGFSGTTVSLDSTAEVSVGDILKDSVGVISRVIEILDANDIVVESALTWTTGASEILQSFQVNIEWTPITGQNPGLLKHFQEFMAFFNKARFSSANFSFYSDISSTSASTSSFSGNSGSQWGLFPWGTAPWGGNPVQTKTFRTYLPRDKQKCSQLSVKFSLKQAYGQFELQGLQLSLRAISNRVGR